MKKPIFKHSRENYVKALYGSLSEDAANIADAEMAKKIDELAEKLDALSQEKGISTSELLEVAVNKANSVEELVVFCFVIGGACEARSSKVIDMLCNMVKK